MSHSLHPQGMQTVVEACLLLEVGGFHCPAAALVQVPPLCVTVWISRQWAAALHLPLLWEPGGPGALDPPVQ